MLDTGPLEEGCRHLRVLELRMDYQQLVAGNRSQGESVQRADQVGMDILLDCRPEWENKALGLVVEGKRSWRDRSSLGVEDTQRQDLLQESRVVLLGSAHRTPRAALPLDLPRN